MKISEFSKLYNITPQAVYAKINRAAKKPNNILDGHVKKINGKSTDIDEFAAEYLRPKPANCDELIAEIEELKEAISQLKAEKDAEISDIREELTPVLNFLKTRYEHALKREIAAAQGEKTESPQAERTMTTQGERLHSARPPIHQTQASTTNDPSNIQH